MAIRELRVPTLVVPRQPTVWGSVNKTAVWQRLTVADFADDATARRVVEFRTSGSYGQFHVGGEAAPANDDGSCVFTAAAPWSFDAGFAPIWWKSGSGTRRISYSIWRYT